MGIPSRFRTSSKQAGSEDVDRVGLFHPSLAANRKKMFKMLGLAFLIITLTMFAMLSLYFGAYYRQTENTYRLTILVLDLDSAAASLSRSALAPPGAIGYEALLGPQVTSAAQNYLARIGPQTNSTYWSLGYVFPSEAELAKFSLPVRLQNGDLQYTQGLNASQYAADAITNQDYFGAIVVNGNATTAALQALSSGSMDYSPMGAITFYYAEARNFFSEDQYVSSQSVELMTTATNKANVQLASYAIRQSNGNAGTLTSVGASALTMGFSYNEHNLQAFSDLGGEPGVTVGAIYLIILTFLASPQWNSFLGKHTSKLTLGSHIWLKAAVPSVIYFFISLSYSLLSLAFHVDMTRKYGRGGFPLYWAINWVTMSALGLVMEFFFTLLGLPFFAFFLYVWVILNVSVLFLDISSMDHWYAYGFIMPVWNESDATKSIFFATKNHLLQNFVVNLAWAAVFGLLLVLLVVHNRSKATKQALREQYDREHPQPKRKVRVFL